MTAIVGFVGLLVFVALIASRRVHVMAALVVVPLAAAIALGDIGNVGEMIGEGLGTVAPTGLLILFSVLFFSTMIDTGLFDPLVNRILRVVGHDPLRITVGTVLLTLLVSLDGDGTTTFILVALTFLPVYKKCGMNPLILMALTSISFYIMNSSPWGGPTTRTMAVLDLSVGEVFTPLVPALAGGIVFIFAAAAVLGLRERKRLGWHSRTIQAPAFSFSLASTARSEPEQAHTAHSPAEADLDSDSDLGQTSPAADSDGSFTNPLESSPELKRPKLIIINLILTVAVMICVIFEVLPPHVTFLLGFVVALLINYRSTEVEGRIRAHAGNALWATALIFAAGSFTGIFSGTGMISEMALTIVHLIPDSFGGQIAVVTGVLSFFGTLIMSPDAFYFGILPILAESGEAYGLTPASVGQAALLGQVGYALSPLVAAPLLLSSLTKVNYVDHQKFSFLWALGCFAVMLIIAVLFGVIPAFT